MNREDLIAKLNKELYKADPAGTFCYENGMHSEYAIEADEIADKFVVDGVSLKTAMIEVFEDRFSGCYNSAILMSVYQTVNEDLL